MQTKHLTVLLALGLPLGACASMPGFVGPVTLNQTDQDFVTTAFNVMQLDDQEGQLAATQAADPRVRAIAGDLSAKAETLEPQVDTALAQDNMTPPTRLPDAAQNEVTALVPLQGKEFDRAYLQDQIASHQRGVAVFQAEQAKTQDPQLRQLAATSLPVVQDSLSKLQAIAASL
jgi:predicted outer membrane protein